MPNTVNLFVNDTWMPEKPGRTAVAEGDAHLVVLEGSRIRALRPGTAHLQHRIGASFDASSATAAAAPVMARGRAAPPPASALPAEEVVLVIRDHAQVAAGAPAAIAADVYRHVDHPVPVPPASPHPIADDIIASAAPPAAASAATAQAPPSPPQRPARSRV